MSVKNPDQALEGGDSEGEGQENWCQFYFWGN